MFVHSSEEPLSSYDTIIWGQTLDDNSFDLSLAIGDFSNSL